MSVDAARRTHELHRLMGRELLAAVEEVEREQVQRGDLPDTFMPAWVSRSLELIGAVMLGLNVAFFAMFFVFYVVNKVLHASF